MTYALIISLSALLVGANQPWDDALGASSALCTPAIVTGNGALTVGLNARGAVTVCRWPSPGYFNQVHYTPRVHSPSPAPPLPGHGLKWGVGDPASGAISWLDEDDWSVTAGYVAPDSTETRIVHRSNTTGRLVSSRCFVHPDMDLLVWQVTLEGFEQTPTLYWLADFSPCTRKLPGLPLADGPLLAQFNDFACFTPNDGRTIYHLRPEVPGRAAWSLAEHLAAQDATLPDDWDAFNHGVWIGYIAMGTIEAFQCGPPDAPYALFKDLKGRKAATGQAVSAVAFTPTKSGNTYTATLIAAFAKDRAHVDETLEYAVRNGPEVLRGRNGRYWHGLLQDIDLPVKGGTQTDARIAESVLTIIQNMDRETGAIVRSIGAWPPLCLDWPRNGAWATLALDMAGLHELAERHTLFYAKALTPQTEPSSPRPAPSDSPPAAFYTDGTPGLPPVVHELDAAAWMIASCWRHAQCLPDAQAKRAYLQKVWPALLPMAQSLADWADGRTQEPMYSFSPNELRDVQSAELLLTTYMGVDAALRIAETLNAEIPQPWPARIRELEALVRFHCVNAQGAWGSGAILPFWQQELAETGLPPWKHLIRSHWESRQAGPRDNLFSESASWETICHAALAWQHSPAKRPQVVSALEKEPLSRADALSAAYCLIAAQLAQDAP